MEPAKFSLSHSDMFSDDLCNSSSMPSILQTYARSHASLLIQVEETVVYYPGPLFFPQRQEGYERSLRLSSPHWLTLARRIHAWPLRLPIFLVEKTSDRRYCTAKNCNKKLDTTHLSRKRRRTELQVKLSLLSCVTGICKPP